MLFTKTLVSIFALASFASAFADIEERDGDVLEVRREEFLEARAAYIEARDNYMIEKRGNIISSSSDGTCKAGATPPACVSNSKNKRCGTCKIGKKSGDPCKCQY
ncbi:unnamed protein product [Clonostachys rosea]|uniref:Invertebrate defensins family profile domain-containing protein n=1 Tax=Bionectria ochroleuca TaxID=29856 RepID=A0ABY6UCN1_BIOOC|nr:unnamed protein product [Clonostachys rosea]